MSGNVGRSTATPEALLQGLLACEAPGPRLSEIGHVAEIGDGIAIVSGLERALADELLIFASGVQGMVLDLEPGRLGVVLLGASDRVSVGEEVLRSHKVASIAVGPELLGRVVDSLGAPLDGNGPIEAITSRPVEADAKAILDRLPVTRPLRTGIKVIDAAVPVGLGQRELIIGDRRTGKTSLGVGAILNQTDTGVICIYCAIGQRGDAVARVIAAIREGGMMPRTLVIAAGDDEAAGLAWLAPYAAMSVAEYFAGQARDVLMVLDDLTHHARSYRELSLLLRRPPGREAFPGDIFFVHARLLERGGQFADHAGGGSITVLPVVETQAGNLSAYIPTNLISITDGQIYLSPRLVRRNLFPAVDLGVSVSRVGGKAQSPALRSVAANLRVTLSQFEELEEFARFGTRLDDATRARLARGSAIRGALRQGESDPMSAREQLAVLVAAMEGQFDGMNERTMAEAMARLRSAASDEQGEIAEHLAEEAPLTEGARERLRALAHRIIAQHGRQTDGPDA